MNDKALRLLQTAQAKSAGAAKGTKGFDPAAVVEPADLRRLLAGLDVFGYFGRALEGWKDITLGDITAAIKKFQSFFKLAGTGRADRATLRAMQLPRCGCPDCAVPGHPYAKMQAAAKAQLAAWKKRGLVYAVAGYVGGLGKPAQDTIFAAGFAAWTQYGQIDARRALANETADIVISGGRGQADGFDGPFGILAYAYLPDGSDQQLVMKIDLDETWSDGNGAGIHLLNVFTHEAGHLFGLSHSRSPGALMAPTYNVAVAAPQQDDDVPRFQARYGVRTDHPPPPPPPPPGGATVSLTTSGAVKVLVNGKEV